MPFKGRSGAKYLGRVFCNAGLQAATKNPGAVGAGIFGLFWSLERNSQSKLELPWIEGGGWSSRLGVQRIHICHIEPVDDVEHIDDPVQLHAFTKLPRSRDAQIGENIVGTNAGISPQIAHQRPV